MILSRSSETTVFSAGRCRGVSHTPQRVSGFSIARPHGDVWRAYSIRPYPTGRNLSENQAGYPCILMILFTFYFLGKQQGRKMLRPYPTGECLGSIFVSRWTRAPEHVSFLDAHFQRSALRQRDNLLFEMGELFRARLCDEITILDTYRAHLWDHKFRLEGDHHARLQRIF